MRHLLAVLFVLVGLTTAAPSAEQSGCRWGEKAPERIEWFEGTSAQGLRFTGRGNGWTWLGSTLHGTHHAACKTCREGGGLGAIFWIKLESPEQRRLESLLDADGIMSGIKFLYPDMDIEQLVAAQPRRTTALSIFGFDGLATVMTAPRTGEFVAFAAAGGCLSIVGLVGGGAASDDPIVNAKSLAEGIAAERYTPDLTSMSRQRQPEHDDLLLGDARRKLQHDQR
jgi:hypothetical protein